MVFIKASYVAAKMVDPIKEKKDVILTNDLTV